MTENEAKWEYCRAIDIIKRIKTEETHERYVDRHKAFDLAIQALEKVQEYEEIGIVEEFKALKEKNEPKKAKGIRKYDEAYCPACNEVIADDEFWALNEYVHHCNYCGQAVKGVDWQ